MSQEEDANIAKTADLGQDELEVVAGEDLKQQKQPPVIIEKDAFGPSIIAALLDDLLNKCIGPEIVEAMMQKLITNVEGLHTINTHILPDLMKKVIDERSTPDLQNLETNVQPDLMTKVIDEIPNVDLDDQPFDSADAQALYDRIKSYQLNIKTVLQEEMDKLKIDSSKLMAISNTWNLKIKQIQDSIKNADYDRVIVKEKLMFFNNELKQNAKKEGALNCQISEIVKHTAFWEDSKDTKQIIIGDMKNKHEKLQNRLTGIKVLPSNLTPNEINLMNERYRGIRNANVDKPEIKKAQMQLEHAKVQYEKLDLVAKKLIFTLQANQKKLLYVDEKIMDYKHKMVDLQNMGNLALGLEMFEYEEEEAVNIVKKDKKSLQIYLSKLRTQIGHLIQFENKHLKMFKNLVFLKNGYSDELKNMQEAHNTAEEHENITKNLENILEGAKSKNQELKVLYNVQRDIMETIDVDYKHLKQLSEKTSLQNRIQTKNLKNFQESFEQHKNGIIEDQKKIQEYIGDTPIKREKIVTDTEKLEEKRAAVESKMKIITFQKEDIITKGNESKEIQIKIINFKKLRDQQEKNDRVFAQLHENYTTLKIKEDELYIAQCRFQMAPDEVKQPFLAEIHRNLDAEKLRTKIIKNRLAAIKTESVKITKKIKSYEKFVNKPKEPLVIRAKVMTEIEEIKARAQVEAEFWNKFMKVLNDDLKTNKDKLPQLAEDLQKAKEKYEEIIAPFEKDNEQLIEKKQDLPPKIDELQRKINLLCALKRQVYELRYIDEQYLPETPTVLADEMIINVTEDDKLPTAILDNVPLPADLTEDSA